MGVHKEKLRNKQFHYTRVMRGNLYNQNKKKRGGGRPCCEWSLKLQGRAWMNILYKVGMRTNLSILLLSVSSLLWLICIFLSIITLGLHIIRTIPGWRIWCFLLLILFTRCWLTWRGFHKGINGELARIQHQANCIDAKNKCCKVADSIYDSPVESRWDLLSYTHQSQRLLFLPFFLFFYI